MLAEGYWIGRRKLPPSQELLSRFPSGPRIYRKIEIIRSRNGHFSEFSLVGASLKPQIVGKKLDFIVGLGKKPTKDNFVKAMIYNGFIDYLPEVERMKARQINLEAFDKIMSNFMAELNAALLRGDINLNSFNNNDFFRLVKTYRKQAAICSGLTDNPWFLNEPAYVEIREAIHNDLHVSWTYTLKPDGSERSSHLLSDVMAPLGTQVLRR